MSACVIAGIGTHVPSEKQTAAQVAAIAGAGAQLAEVGFEARYHPPRDISPFHLASGASRLAMADARIGPDDLDQILTVGKSRAEYLCWGLSLAIGKEFRCKHTVGTDLCDFTGGTLLSGLRVALAKFQSDPRRNTALLAVHQRASDFVDLSVPKEKWLWPLGDGGAALVLQRTGPGIVPLGHAFAHDGRASKQLAMRFDIIDEGPHPQDFYHHEWAQAKYMTMRDADLWYADYRDRAIRRLPEVIELAVQRSGLRLEDIARIQAGHTYPEIGRSLQQRFGNRFRAHNAHGILGGAELGFALQDLRADAGLRGKHVVLCGAALPASYGAMVFRL